MSLTYGFKSHLPHQKSREQILFPAFFDFVICGVATHQKRGPQKIKKIFWGEERQQSVFGILFLIKLRSAKLAATKVPFTAPRSLTFVNGLFSLSKQKSRRQHLCKNLSLTKNFQKNKSANLTQKSAAAGTALTP